LSSSFDLPNILLTFIHPTYSLQAEALGRDKVKFPMQRDPCTLIRLKHPTLRIHQSAALILTSNNLMIGWEAMETKFQEQWLADIKNRDFKIVSANAD
jgi:hypothetical protein